MKRLEKQLSKLEAQLTHFEKLNPVISKSSIGWHIDHSLLSTILIISAVERSNPKDYKWKFNFVRTYIFVKNEIPRGKAKAPKSVVPEEIITKDDILLKIEKAKEKIANLKNLPRKANFNHPYFGNLNLKQTIKFLNLHIEHHLKIINDILSKL